MRSLLGLALSITFIGPVFAVEPPANPIQQPDIIIDQGRTSQDERLTDRITYGPTTSCWTDRDTGYDLY
jgi:hypothetical protein